MNLNNIYTTLLAQNILMYHIQNILPSTNLKRTILTFIEGQIHLLYIKPTSGRITHHNSFISRVSYTSNTMSSISRTTLACLVLLFLSVTLVSHAASRLLPETSGYEKHEQWMARYGRVYKDTYEKEQRSKIFQENVRYIESFNSDMNKSYKLAVNEFADLTNEEFRTARNRFLAHECSPSTSAFRYENVTAVPSSMDWRKKGAVTPIKDQGQCGKHHYFTNFTNQTC